MMQDTSQVTSVNRLGDFLNFFATNFLTLVAQILAVLKDSTFKEKTAVPLFGQLCIKLATFIQTSGHIGRS